MKRTGLILCLLILATPAFPQAQQNQAQMSAIPVAGPVYMLQGGGGNIGVIADPAGIVMIDSMDERSAPQIRGAIRSLPGGPKIKFLIDTHWHSDHTDGNKVFGPESTTLPLKISVSLRTSALSSCRGATLMSTISRST